MKIRDYPNYLSTAMASNISGEDPTTTIPCSPMTTILASNPITTTASVATVATAPSPARPMASAPQIQQARPPQFLQHQQQRHHHQLQPSHLQQQHQHQHQRQHGVFAAQTPIQIQTQTQPRPQLGKASEPVLYPLVSSDRGLLPTPRGIRPQLPDQMVTVANPIAYPQAPPPPLLPRSTVAAYPPPPPPTQAQHQHTRLFAPDSPQPPHSARPIRAPYLHPSHGHMPSFSVTASAAAGVRGISLNPQAQSKVLAASSPCSAPENNCQKDPIDKGRDDTYVTVRDRKVRTSDGASIYALCRSWLRNGYPVETQPQYGDFIKSLPKPLPMPSESSSPKRMESDDEQDEEDVKSVESLDTKELLRRHIKRAKRGRARSREERLQRIERYKSRLALLLPPLVEQCRNITNSGT